MVFDKTLMPSFLQVTFGGTSLIRCWSLLLKDKEHLWTKTACRLLETVVMKLFTRNG
ncbi:hypothetical protein PR202_ga24601 [Eleusine coracana subsp. coracana]|uniref:Uncharacterized protein n=1 Tax=Eleusine coracana subsp. coracana TaxID=191504 RepID=A0AAV5D986_ELECO|nr:hypothetical protein PR202_ga24601 [Eleusine coracana subsp. coracana]